MKELIVVEELKAVDVFTKNGSTDLLERIKAEVRLFVPDLSSVKSRKEIASLAHKVSRSKVLLENMGKDLVAEQKALIKIVDNERIVIKNSLDELRDEIKRPLVEWEQIDKTRIDNHSRNLNSIKSFFGKNTDDMTSDDIASDLVELTKFDVDSSWEEFEKEAASAYENSVSYLENRLGVKLKKEEEEEELAQLRKEKAERDQKDREEKIARDASDKARQEAETIAEKHRIDAEAKATEDKRIAKVEADKADAREKKLIRDAELAEIKRLADIEEAKRLERNRIKKEEDRKLALEKSRKEDEDRIAKIKSELHEDIGNFYKSDESMIDELVDAIMNNKVRNLKVVY